MEIPILIALILLNGVFAMSEIALVTARKARLQKLIDEGDSAAAAAQAGEDPTRFLSTIQIGITSIGVLNGIFGEAALAQPLSVWLEQWGMPVSTPARSPRPGGGPDHLCVHRPGRTGTQAPGPDQPRVHCPSGGPPHQPAGQADQAFVWMLTSSTLGLLKLLGVRRAMNPR
jgi:putative hemolysin